MVMFLEFYSFFFYPFSNLNDDLTRKLAKSDTSFEASKYVIIVQFESELASITPSILTPYRIYHSFI